MQPFVLADFLQPLSPEAIAATLIVGLAVGAFFLGKTHMEIWQPAWGLFVVGSAWFVTYVAFRNLDGATAWSRNVGAYALWLLYVLAVYIGEYLRDRVS